MAVTAVSAQKYDARRWGITIEVDGDTLNESVHIPNELPEGVLTSKAYLKNHAKRMVQVYRNRKQSVVDAVTERALWEVTPSNQSVTASEFLIELQNELDT